MKLQEYKYTTYTTPNNLVQTITKSNGPKHCVPTRTGFSNLYIIWILLLALGLSVIFFLYVMLTVLLSFFVLLMQRVTTHKNNTTRPKTTLRPRCPVSPITSRCWPST